MKKALVIIALIFVFCVAIFVSIVSLYIIAGIRLQTVSGNSMQKYLVDGDVILTIGKTPSRFDVVTYKVNNITQIKRVIAIPGDTISTLDAELKVNGKPAYTNANIPTIDNQTSTYLDNLSVLEDNYTLQDDEYILIGDNLNNSLDSRQQGLVTKNELISVVILKLI